MGRTAAGRFGWGLGYEPGPAVISLLSAPNGLWQNISDPRAYYYNGKTYFGWHNGVDGTTRVAEYVHSTGNVSTPVTLRDIVTPDIHNSGAVLVRSSDHRIIVAYSDHSETRMRVRISTNAEDATAFGSEILAGTGSGEHTYASLFEISGTIYLFYRKRASSKGYLTYQTSADGGATWSAETRLLTTVSAEDPYWRLWSDGTNVHIAITDTNRGIANPSSVYHFYYDGATLRNSSGTSVGALPAQVTSGTLVHDDSEGPAWSDGVAFDGSTPCILLIVHDSVTPTNTIKFARWSGSAWAVHTVTGTNGILSSNKFISSAAMLYADPYTIYAPRLVGAKFEMYRHTSPDSGVTWISHARTGGSAVDHAMPGPVANGTADLPVIWGAGTYTSDNSFSFGVTGGR